MVTRAKWIERVRQWERSGLDAAEFAAREGIEAEALDEWRRKVQSDEPAARRVEPRRFAVRVEEPTTALAPAWIEIGLPNRALVRVLPGVDAMTFACVLAVATELSAQAAAPAHPAPTTQVASRRGRR
jgi:hypothetical protein